MTVNTVDLEIIMAWHGMALPIVKICDKMRSVKGQNGVLTDIYKGLNREKEDLSATFGLESP